MYKIKTPYALLNIWNKKNHDAVNIAGFVYYAATVIYCIVTEQGWLAAYVGLCAVNITVKSFEQLFLQSDMDASVKDEQTGPGIVSTILLFSFGVLLSIVAAGLSIRNDVAVIPVVVVTLISLACEFNSVLCAAQWIELYKSPAGKKLVSFNASRTFLLDSATFLSVTILTGKCTQPVGIAMQYFVVVMAVIYLFTAGPALFQLARHKEVNERNRGQIKKTLVEKRKN